MTSPLYGDKRNKTRIFLFFSDKSVVKTGNKLSDYGQKADNQSSHS